MTPNFHKEKKCWIWKFTFPAQIIEISRVNTLNQLEKHFNFEIIINLHL